MEFEYEREVYLAPPQAATTASEVDVLYFALVGLTIFFTALICVLIVTFMVRYRSTARLNRRIAVSHKQLLFVEIGWSIVPLVVVMTIFFWGAGIYFDQKQAPEDPLHIYVVGKQWMWKVQHEGGRREINSLHVPTGRPVQLTMISEDVIHSFYIPAFRTKMDVLPGRFTAQWFEATQTGTYHLFCAEYCGTDHSQMVGSVVVQTPEEYARWLESAEEEPAASRGRRLFQKYRCNDCHGEGDDRRGPRLENLLGSRVVLTDGRTITADAQYFRNSIRDPDAQIVAGYQALMPPFPQISEEEILLIMAYLESERAGIRTSGSQAEDEETQNAQPQNERPQNERPQGAIPQEGAQQEGGQQEDLPRGDERRQGEPQETVPQADGTSDNQRLNR